MVGKLTWGLWTKHLPLEKSNLTHSNPRNGTELTDVCIYYWSVSALNDIRCWDFTRISWQVASSPHLRERSGRAAQLAKLVPLMFHTESLFLCSDAAFYCKWCVPFQSWKLSALKPQKPQWMKIVAFCKVLFIKCQKCMCPTAHGDSFYLDCSSSLTAHNLKIFCLHSG